MAFPDYQRVAIAIAMSKAIPMPITAYTVDVLSVTGCDCSAPDVVVGATVTPTEVSAVDP
jgi:hypothetical protein